MASSRGAGDLPMSPCKNRTGDDDNNNKEVRLFQFEGSKLTLEEYIKEWNARVGRRLKFLEKNSMVQYEEFEKLVKGKKLDSNLKKCTAFVRKMRQFHESLKSCAESDIRQLNLTKYISEIALDIVELRLKPTDVSSLLSVCSELHKRYREFGAQLLENFENALMVKNLASNTKLSGDFRLFGELFLGGILPKKEACNLLIQAIQNLVAIDKDGSQSIPVLVALLREFTFELVGVIPRDVRIALEDHVCQSQLIQPSEVGLKLEEKASLKTLIRKYFSQYIKPSLVKRNDKVLGSAKFIRKLFENKGDAPADRQSAHQEMVSELEKYHSSIAKLANLLDVQTPKLRHLSINPDEDLDKELMLLGQDGGEGAGELGALFEDEETKQFYLDLFDLKTYFAEKKNGKVEASSQEKTTGKQDAKESESEGKDEDEDSSDSENDVDELDSDSLSDSDSESDDIDLDAEKEELMLEGEDSDEDEDVLPSMRDDAEENASAEESLEEPVSASVSASSSKMSLRMYFFKLKNCVGKDMVDKAACDFVDNFRSKKCRSEVAKHLFSLPRQRMDLLRLFCRLAATLSTIYPDIGQEICDLLRRDFRYLVHKRDQQRLESKLRITRFIGELTNFSVFTKNDAFNCFKMLLRNFTHHQIEMTCCFLETCGVFLYRSRDSHRRMKLYLDEMLRRKKTSQFLESRYSYMVDCAYYQICRPAGVTVPKKVKSPLHTYMEYILRFDLSRETLERANKVLRTFDWKDPAKCEMVLSILSSPWKLNYSQLDAAAALLVSLKNIRPSVSQAVIENISQVVRIGCEFESEDINNMRMSTCQYMAYLYNYKCISTTSLLNVMYYLISYGVSYQQHDVQYFGMDPPDSLTRIRVICHMLRIVGDFVTGSRSNRRVDFFLKYFQRYFLYKRGLPVWEEEHVGGRKRFPHNVEEMFEDTIKRMRGKWKFVKTVEEAEEEILALDKSLREKVKSVKVKRAISGERRTGFGVKIPKDYKKRQVLYSKPVSYAKKATSQKWNKNRNGRQGGRMVEPVAVLESVEEEKLGSEDEFEKEFQAMCDFGTTAVAESVIPGGGGGGGCSSSTSLSSSSRTTGGNSKVVPVARVGGGFAESGMDALHYGLPTVKVTVLTKRNNKPKEKTLEVESKEDFLVSIKQREEQEMMEKLEVKTRTLELTRRQQEEEHMNMISALYEKFGKVVTRSNKK